MWATVGRSRSFSWASSAPGTCCRAGSSGPSSCSPSSSAPSSRAPSGPGFPKWQAAVHAETGLGGRESNLSTDSTGLGVSETPAPVCDMLRRTPRQGPSTSRTRASCTRLRVGLHGSTSYWRRNARPPSRVECALRGRGSGKRLLPWVHSEGNYSRLLQYYGDMVGQVFSQSASDLALVHR